MWRGSAAICLNSKQEILMVLQGKPDEEKKWSVPTGGKLPNETYEQCCVREVWEETGYEVKVIRKLYEKKGQTYGIDVLVHYFEAVIIGGRKQINDPDQLIHEVSWKSIEEIRRINLAYPEDKELITEFVNMKNGVSS